MINIKKTLSVFSLSLAIIMSGCGIIIDSTEAPTSTEDKNEVVTEAVTVTPTTAPTETVTPSPTPHPTKKPTPKPTASPTPTLKPSPSPEPATEPELSSESDPDISYDHSYYECEEGFFYYEEPIYDKPSLIFIGDSRFSLLIKDVGKRPSDQIALVHAGSMYDWFVNTAIPYLHGYLELGPDASVIINMGVNDCATKILADEYYYNYVDTINGLIDQYPDAKFFFLSVGPVNGSYTGLIEPEVLNKATTEFNKNMKANCKAIYIDGSEYLNKNGYSTLDGIHYDEKTDGKIYNYCLKKVKESK